MVSSLQRPDAVQRPTGFHSNENTEEDRDDGHERSITPDRQLSVAPLSAERVGTLTTNGSLDLG
jgi:hypothetical protein